MRRVLKIVLAAVPFLASAPAAGAAPEVGKHTTPAGHVFWYVPLEEAKRTAVSVTWTAGLPRGPDTHEATARLGISLMLSGGAGGIASDELSADFEDLDSGSRLWAQPGEIRGFVVAPEDSLQEAAQIVNLWLAKPDFDERWLEREKRTLLRNVRVRGETASGAAWNLAREILLDDHPYNRFWSIAPADDVRTIDRDAIAAWHRGSFGTADITITAAGSASADAVGKAVAEPAAAALRRPGGHAWDRGAARSRVAEIAYHGVRADTAAYRRGRPGTRHGDGGARIGAAIAAVQNHAHGPACGVWIPRRHQQFHPPPPAAAHGRRSRNGAVARGAAGAAGDL